MPASADASRRPGLLRARDDERRHTRCAVASAQMDSRATFSWNFFPWHGLEPYQGCFISREVLMNVVKLAVAAATITAGLAVSASAMPAPKLGTVDIGIEADQVRT